MDIATAFNKSIFLLGAGASYGTGCKMSQDMLNALLEEILRGHRFSSTQKEAFMFLLSCLEYHNKWRSFQTNNKFIFTPNIEELALLIRRVKNRENFLPYPITGNWADKLSLLESQHLKESSDETLFESLDRIIKQELLPSWLVFDKEKLKLFDPLRQLLADYAEEDFKIDLFSLNYDLVIESYFNQYDVRPWRGFSNNDWRGFSFEEDSMTGKINLYKLHGSLDWVRLESGEVKEIDHCTNEELSIIDSRHNPYVIFGHGTKTFSVDPFFDLVHKFKSKLTYASYIFVIGYSFFDPYINNLIIEALNKGNKRLIIINPTFGPQEIKYKTAENIEEAKTIDNKNVNKILVEYIEAIQANPFYSEMPEFNIKRINGENSIIYYRIGFEKFINDFFSNRGLKFKKLINLLETEKQAEDAPFE